VDSPQPPPGHLFIGRLGAPRGVRGDLKVHSYSGEYEHFLDLAEVDLMGPATRLRLKVERIEAGGGGLSMAFAGYASPEAARVLTGLEIVAPRSEAAPLKKDEWYATDLVGSALVLPGPGGAELAVVASVLDGGPEPWLEALLPDGRKAIVPFRKEFVGAVDLAARRIELLAPWILE
jgi:16S rRNA processing protein RimM